MRNALICFILVAMAALPAHAMAQENGSHGGPGCGLPHVAELVRQIFGPYAVAMHSSGQVPGAESQNGKMRVMGQGMVACRFVRTDDPLSESIYILLRSYTNENDAAIGFTNVMPMFTTHKHIGSVQLNERPGHVNAYLGTSLAEVRWTGAGTMRDNASINAARLEPLAMVLVCPDAKSSC